MAGFSDYLQMTSGGLILPNTGVFVRLVSNNTGTAYVSDALTDSNGKFTFATKPPGDTYTVYTGPSNTGPWTSTGDVSYAVPVVAGETPAFQSTTVLASGPYAPDATLPTGGAAATVLKVTGITGAVQLGRWVGTTMYGPPTTGTFLAGDWVNTLIGTIQICTTGGSPGTWISTQQGCVNVLDYGAGTGLSDNSTAFNAAIAALPSSGGVVLVPGSASVYSFTNPINGSQATNVCLQGAGGRSGGIGTASLLRFTPSTGPRFVDFRSSTGCSLRDLYIQSNSSTFAGTLVDFSHSIALDASYGMFRNLTLAITGETAGSIVLNLDRATRCDLDGVTFMGGAIQISGGSTYCNAIHLHNIGFTIQSNTQAINCLAGQAWTLDGITLEAGGRILNTDIVQWSGLGLTVDGAWAGDVGTGSTGSLFLVAGKGIMFGGGCYLNTVTGSTAITIPSVSSGICIFGEIAGGGTGVAWGSGVASHVIYGANNECVTPASGTVVSGYLATANQLLMDPGATNPAITIGQSSRPKIVQWNSSNSPNDVLELISKGSTGGWKGTIDLEVSFSAGTVVQGIRVQADSNGTAADLGFFGAAAVAQPSAAGTATGYAAGATAATFHSDDTYTGNTGTTGYTINGIVAALKNLGLLHT